MNESDKHPQEPDQPDHGDDVFEQPPAQDSAHPKSIRRNEDRYELVSHRELLARHWVQVQPSVTAFIRAAVPQYHDAEDILQEVAAEVAVRFDEYDPTRPFLPWAIWVAKIKIADFYRTRKRLSNVLSSHAIEALAVACGTTTVSFADETECLEQCMSMLTVRSRYLLSLRYEEGLKPAAIAEKLKTTPGTVRVTLTRIRDSLAECMRRQLAQKGLANE